MAFPTLSIVYFIEPRPTGGSWPVAVLPKPSASRESATAGTIATPVTKTGSQRIIASILPTADIWLTVGTTPPDPSLAASTRLPVPASSPMQIYLENADSLRWALA